MSARRWRWTGVAAVVGGLLGFWLNLAGLLVLVTAGVIWTAWELGRVHEAKRVERELTVAAARAFSDWAERALACAPEELPADQELLRQRLQVDYQRAQDMLRELGG